MSGGTIYIGEEAPAGADIIFRRTVRCVSQNPGGFPMLRTSSGNYRFPGGGVEPGETDEEALRREVLEETGYHVKRVGRVLFSTVQRNIDYKDKSRYFVMESAYMECAIDLSVSFGQRLSPGERSMELIPVFVPLREALRENEAVGVAYPTHKREILAIRRLLELYPPEQP